MRIMVHWLIYEIQKKVMQRLMIIIHQENLIYGNLNTLGWVVSKSSMIMGNKSDEYLARLNIIESEDKCWQKLVNTDYERSILFPGNYGDSRFDNKDIPFVC